MPSTETLLAFFGVSLLLGITPGPDLLFVLVQSAQRGWRAGMAVVFGLCAGLVCHTVAVALGLAALFAASETAFAALKYVGAAYLAFLAWQALQSSQPKANGNSDSEVRNDTHAADAGATAAGATLVKLGRAASSPWRMVGRGMLMNLTNPKILIFFLAFLPQFADPANGSVAFQILVLGAVFVASTLLVFGAIAVFSGTFGAMLLGSARAQRWLDRAAAVVFLGLAVRLVTVSR